MIVASAFMCLSLTVYHEARGESLLGQRAVALTVWNRAHQDPSQVCQVVFKNRQFSWVNDKVERMGGIYKVSVEKPQDKQALSEAKETALLVLAGRMYDFTRGADHYHVTSVYPIWRHAMTKLTVIGRHIFYRST